MRRRPTLNPRASAKFAVASIKLAAPGPHFMFGVRHMPGGGFSANNVTLKRLIATAYDLRIFQLSGGPGWIETERYNIEAKPDSPVGPNEWKEMLQNLLADRFHLAFHRETKELPVYTLCWRERTASWVKGWSNRRKAPAPRAIHRSWSRRVRGSRRFAVTSSGSIRIDRDWRSGRRHGPGASDNRRPQGDR